MKVALVSLDQVFENKALNREKALAFIKEAASKGCCLVVFPEMTLTGFSKNAMVIKEDFAQSGTISFFKEKAKLFRIHIAFGVVLDRVPLATNNLVMIDPRGQVIANYAKIHPFSYSDEDKYYIQGDELGVCDVESVPVGLSICYDLRFPELFQALSKKCQVLITIANWPEKRIDHWDVLLKARAIENQVFCIGVNRVGVDTNGINYVKSSQIIDPLGCKLTPITAGEEFDIYDLDLNAVSIWQKEFPVKKDRRVALYKEIL